MNQKLFLLLISLSLFFVKNSNAQNLWPRDIVTEKGAIITLFQPQPETLNNNIMVGRTVVSVKVDKKSEPVFGVFWYESILNTDKDSRMAALEKISITQMKFPDGTDTAKISALKKILEVEIPKWNLIMPLDEIIATLEEDQGSKSDDLNTKAPEIIYSNQLTTLILIDGEPIVKEDKDIKMDKVVNTPFLILKSGTDKKYYLYAEKFWYTSDKIETGWLSAQKLPADISALNKEIEKKLKESKEANTDTTQAKPTAILVKTKPAELLQTEGEAKFASIEGTSLLYISNSPDNIFKVVDDQQYYVLLAGRWFKSGSLQGPWTFVESDKLHPDFAKIPEGSDKDEVLAHVAGTDAA